MPRPLARLVSPALVAGEIKKNETYSRWMMIANRASTAGKRPDRLVFHILFSACGEAAKGATAILGIVWKFKARAVRHHPRLAGCP